MESQESERGPRLSPFPSPLPTQTRQNYSRFGGDKHDRNLGLPSDDSRPPELFSTMLPATPSERMYRRHRGLRSLRDSIGLYGSIAVFAGSLTTLAALAFLGFLWFSGGRNDGVRAPPIWRSIVLNQKLAQTVTISSAIIRIIIGIQASVSAGLVAALLLENYGVPLLHVAEISIIRSVNDGPFRLANLLLGSRAFLRSAKLPTALLLIAMTVAVSSQFLSTILLSDLSISTVVGYQNLTYIASDLDQRTGAHVNPAASFVVPPVFAPFGELSGPPNTSLPNNLGVSDTGLVQRVFIPLPEAERKSIRSYEGKGYVLSSQWTCMPPAVRNLGISADAQDQSFQFGSWIVDIAGNISVDTTLRQSGMDFQSACADGRCNNLEFNCSLPTVLPRLVNSMFDGRGVAVCVPDESFRFSKNGNTWRISDGTDLGIVMYLVITTNLTDATVQANSFPKFQEITKPLQSANNGEFLVWTFRGFSLSVSFCTEQLQLDLADVALSAPRDLPSPDVNWDPANIVWDTTDLQRLFGVPISGQPPLTPTQRGLYTVEALGNMTTTSLSYNTTFNILRNGNAGYVSMLLGTADAGLYTVVPSDRTIALFNDMMVLTNRPALALLNIMTVWSTINLSSVLSQLTIKAPAAIIASVDVLTPQAWRGLVVVAGIVLMNLGSTMATTYLFLRWTRFSRQGCHWQSVAQVASEETQWIVDRSTELRDSAVAQMIKRQGAAKQTVSMARSSDNTGRVQVVRARKD